jgi:cyclopropane-fatty-acyl-phospholipid synthase
VAAAVGIGPRCRLLDLGCGRGPLLDYVRARGGAGLGVTLSSAQLRACRRHGLEDAREISRERFGGFDAVASLGAFEHFCSSEDYQTGRQEEVYRDLFARVSHVLPPGGRFYLQTMVFGPNMIPAQRIDLEALKALPPRDSDERYTALPGASSPGSWLPFGQEQVIRSAEPYFRLVSSIGGRLDCIETIDRWNERIVTPSLPKDTSQAPAAAALARQCRLPLGVSSGESANQVRFQRELLDHYRLMFENKG